MFEVFERLIGRLRDVWDSMTLNQKVISGGALVASIVAIAYLFTLRGNLIDYSVLFNELDSKSASEITTLLNQQNIPFRLSQDGRTIEVPREKATQLKIDLTAQGLPETGIVGFEILDTTTFGMSQRIQEVQIQRALQGEISKAIMSLDAVEFANVNLSIPKPTLFTEKEEPVTAAVIIKLKRGGTISQKKAEGLTYFISYAVPGLDPMNVTILDTKGNSLTKTFRDEAAMISSTQWEYKVRVDRYLADEATKMLDGAFGNGKSLVTVNAELDWDRIERQTTSYSPEESTLLSEDRTTETTPTPDGLGELEQSTTNYETGQTIENFVKNTGDIAHLSVSVFIDRRDSTWVDEEDVIQFAKVSWSETQLASIRLITENAVGYKPDRGDKIEVVEADFSEAGAVVGTRSFIMGASVVELVRAAFLGIAIIAAVVVFYFLIKSIVSSLEPSKMALRAEEEFKKHKGEIEEEEEVVTSDRDMLVKKIMKASTVNPEIAAKTLKSLFKE